VFGLISFALGFFILDAAMAFLKHGPSMRAASIALFACAGMNFLIGAIAVSVSISRFSDEITSTFPPGWAGDNASRPATQYRPG
jgi:hypothetical protein